ncbi:MAG: hypothetical protein AAGI34_04800 [Pseudomonadota bacterium]
MSEALPTPPPRAARPEIRIDPSGRPLERAGFEAVFALGLLTLWVVLISGVFALMGRDMAGAGLWPSLTLTALCCFCWAYAEHIVGRRGLIWPGSALGLLGPLSLGFAAALTTPELRTGPFLDRLALVASVAGVAMIPFMFRFRLPGLVSPIITFSLVGLFLVLYGADTERLRQMEGFSPRGIIAALMNEPSSMALFGVLSLGATVLARHLDGGDNFKLAAARPLHLIGAGVLALVVGRLFAMLPQPYDVALLALAWIVAHVWTLRVNRVAVAFASHFAMAKPMILAVAGLYGIESFTLMQWVWMLSAVLLFDLLTWPYLHWLSREIGWTLGPGLRLPPDKPGVIWRYWPYA